MITMATEQEIIALLRLQKTANVGDVTAKKLITYFGSASEIFLQKRSSLEKINGIGSVLVANLLNDENQKAAENEWNYICKNNIQFCAFTDETYPKNLAQAPDSPILFFYNGNINWTQKKIVSIVGTRQITPYGRDFCEKMVTELSPLRENLIIVSGFAYGVDIVAHKTAMQNGIQTIGCLAHGLNQVYPSAHKKYCQQMLQNGGFITDFWHDSLFDRKNFLSRNRIIAGLADATIVIESAKKGGSLVTADIAFSYNREVFAVPGRISDPYSEGCNDLIRSEKARIFHSIDDFLERMNWEAEQVQKPITPLPELSPDEQLIYIFLSENGTKQLDEISREMQIPIHKLSNVLFQLEMKGVVRALPGKFFSVG